MTFPSGPIATALPALLLVAQAPTDPLPGVWEGSSLCQIKSSPCHDEHVVYHVTRTRTARYRFAMYKMVSGQDQFMGNLDIQLDAWTGLLSGSSIDREGKASPWTFVRSGDRMNGRLLLTARGPLYRLITLKRH